MFDPDNFELQAVDFYGYYDSPFYNYDNIYYEVKDLDPELTEEEVNLAIDDLDLEEYQNDLNKLYMDTYIDLMNERFPIQDDDFIVSLEDSTTMESPREYNFQTDTIFRKVKLNKKKLNEIHHNCINDPKFRTKFLPQFSDRDGFISFYSDKYQDWTSLWDLDEVQVNQLLFWYYNLISDIEITDVCTEVCITELNPVAYID